MSPSQTLGTPSQTSRRAAASADAQRAEGVSSAGTWSRTAANWAAWTAVLVGFALRLGGRDVHSLWFDEGDTLAIAFSHDPCAVLRDSHYPPLSFLAFRHWARVFGDDTSTLRLLPALSSCLALVFFAWLARRWQSPSTAAVSIALYAVSAFHVWHGQELRGYAFLELGGLLGLCGTEWAMGRHRWLGMLTVAAGQALALGTHYMGVLLAPAIAGMALVAWRRRGVGLGSACAPVAAAIAGCAVWLPWIVTVVPLQLHAPGGYVAHMSARDFVELPMRLVLVELSAIPSEWHWALAALVALLLAAFYAAAVAALLRREPLPMTALVVFVAPVASAVAMTLVAPPSFLPKYVIVAAPGATLLIGAGLRASRSGFARGVICAFALLGCASITLAQKQHNLREDYRSACAELVDSWRPGDRWTIVSGTNPTMEAGAVQHYLRGREDVLTAQTSVDDFLSTVGRGQDDAMRLHVIYRYAPYAEQQFESIESSMTPVSRGKRRFRIEHSVWARR